MAESEVPELATYETPEFWAGMREKFLATGNPRLALIVREMGLDGNLFDRAEEQRLEHIKVRSS